MMILNARDLFVRVLFTYFFLLAESGRSRRMESARGGRRAERTLRLERNHMQPSTHSHSSSSTISSKHPLSSRVRPCLRTAHPRRIPPRQHPGSSLPFPAISISIKVIIPCCPLPSPVRQTRTPSLICRFRILPELLIISITAASPAYVL